MSGGELVSVVLTVEQVAAVVDALSAGDQAELTRDAAAHLRGALLLAEVEAASR